MMWDIEGNGIVSNTMSMRNRSRSPQPPRMMPSRGLPILHSEANATIGSSVSIPMSSSYPPVPVSTSYHSYVRYPSEMPHATPSPFPSPQIVHVHHSKHHSSKHHHNHSGHGRSHSHSQLRPSPSPSPMMPFPSSPSPSFPMPSPYIHFPTMPPPPFQSSRSNALHKVPPAGHIHSQPPPKHSTKETSKLLSKPKPHMLPPYPDFQHSNCTGRRKALCIGINYRGQENELRGCINDARNVRDFLLRNNYKSNEIILLTEATSDPRRLPTYHNILEAMRWLVRGARPHDSLFFHYSGHGGQVRDLDGDEADGWDEVIYPLDYKTYGHILDDLMHDIMVKPLPQACRLTGLFDACHSGSVLDLPFVYSAHGRLKSSPITPRALASKATLADVISWSACQDGETSADTFSGGVAVGAMSNAFITAFNRNSKQTYQEFFRALRLILSPRYSQKPQLGSSHHIDTTRPFIF